MLSLATVVATLLRLRAGACVVLACLAAMLYASSIASAHPAVQAQTRVWDFSSAALLNTWLERSTRPRTHLGNQSGSAKLASGSLLAARAGASTAERVAVLGNTEHVAARAAQLGNKAEVFTPAAGLSRDALLEANQVFLEGIVRNRQVVELATSVAKARPGSIFKAEIAFLRQHGYTLSADGARLLPP